MNVHLSILTGLIVLLHLSVIQAYPLADPHFSKEPLTVLAKNGESPSAKEDSKSGPIPAIEEYEREKLAKLKRNIGRRLMTVPNKQSCNVL